MSQHQKRERCATANEKRRCKHSPLLAASHLVLLIPTAHQAFAMRKILVGAQLSLDGIMQAPGGKTEDPSLVARPMKSLPPTGPTTTRMAMMAASSNCFAESRSTSCRARPASIQVGQARYFFAALTMFGVCAKKVAQTLSRRVAPSSYTHSSRTTWWMPSARSRCRSFSGRGRTFLPTSQRRIATGSPGRAYQTLASWSCTTIGRARSRPPMSRSIRPATRNAHGKNA